MVNKSDVERLLYSLLDKQVISKKFNGDARIQQSALGYNTSARIDRQEEGGTIKLASQTLGGYDTLKFYSTRDDGKTNAMQVYMPHFFKEYIGEEGNLLVKKDGIYQGNRKIADKDLLEIIGFRIPTDGLHSIDFIDIAGFLPREAGPVVVTPAELTVKVGTDFDYDKYTFYFPSYRKTVNGTLVKRNYITHTDPNEGLRLLYQEKYGPTLSFWTELTKDLAEAGRVDFYIDEQNYGRTSKLVSKVNNLIEAIFEENAENLFTQEEIDVLSNKFRLDQWEDLSLDKEDITPSEAMDIMRDRLEAAEEKYNRIKERIESIPSIDEFIEDSAGKSYAELNHPGAVQNRLMEIQREILSHPSNFEQLLSPTSTARAKEIAINIQNAKSEIGPRDLDWSEIISFKNTQIAAHRMWAGMDVLGIFAVNNTSHVKAQLAELYGPNVIKYINFGNSPNISLAKVYDAEGNRIKDSLSELVNAATDVSTDQFLFDLNITPETANVAMYLIRSGVPLDWTAYFLNQPIILRYLELKAINNNLILEEVDSVAYDWEIRTQVEKEFEKDVKPAVVNKNILFSTSELQLTLGVDLSVMRASHERDGIKAPGASFLNQQKQILEDYFVYEQMGLELSRLTSAASFDTVNPINRHHAEHLIYKYAEAVSEGETSFTNGDKMIDNTHMKSLSEITNASREIFSDLFELNSDNFLQKLGIYQIADRIGLKNEAARKFFETYENDLITALLTQSENLEPRINELFFGSKSLPIRIAELRTNPNYANNKFIKDLLPIIRVNRKMTGEVDNLQYYTLLRNTFEKNVSRDSFFALPADIQNDLVDFAILQGGLNYSNMSLLRLLPNELYATKSAKALKLVRAYKKGGRNSIIENFNDLFFRNNWQNKDIVPHLTSRRFNLLKQGRIKGDKFAKYPYIAQKSIVNGESRIDLYKRLRINDNGTIDYGPATKLGNDKYLKEYIQSSLTEKSVDGYVSVLQENNRKTQLDTTKTAKPKSANKGKVIKQEAETIKQQDREDSIKCNPKTG